MTDEEINRVAEKLAELMSERQAYPTYTPYVVCNSPYHNPPAFLYIPPGTYYEHRCPQCGASIMVGSPYIVW
jgi:hypothetical protein